MKQMQNKGVLSVFHKHLEREVLNTAEFHQLLECMRYFENIHLFKSVISPISAFLKNKGISSIRAGRVGIEVIDAVAEKTIEAAAVLTEKAIKIPINISENIVHRGILAAGRMFYPGDRYIGPAPTEKDIQVLRKMPSTQEEAQAFAEAAVKGAKYEDLIALYAPYTWRTIKTGYSVGELLDIERTTFDKSHKTIEFDANLYEEVQDVVIRKHNIWQLKQETENKVAVFKAEIIDIL